MKKPTLQGRNQITAGAALSYAGIIVSIASGVFVTPLMLRHLGSSQYGLFALCSSLTTLLAFDFGMNSAVARFVAVDLARDDQAAAKRLICAVRRAYLLLDILLATSCVAVIRWAPRIFGALSSNEVTQFQWAFAIASAFSIATFPLQVANGTLQGSGHFLALRGSDLAWRVLASLGTLLIVVLGLGLNMLVAVSAGSAFAVAAYRAYKAYRIGLWGRPRTGSLSRLEQRDIFSYIGWSMVVALGQRLTVLAMPSLLGALSGSFQVSAFSIAAIIEGYFWMLANALNGLFLPSVAGLLESGDRSRLQSLFVTVGRAQSALLFAGAGALAACGSEFFELWAGPAYRGSVVACLVLIAPVLISHTQEVGTTALVAAGEVRFRAAATALSVMVCLPTALITVPRWGALGAALAVCLGGTISQVVFMNVVFTRVVKLDVSNFFRKATASFLPLAFTAAGVSIVVARFFASRALTTLGVELTVYSLILGWLYWTVGSTREERQWIMSRIAKGRFQRT